tara:strand:- start:828 stop:1232 length:405 start_codon:yes stop_codon:yes gene_type:complete
MTWLAFKFAMKKAWIWSKHHWKIIAIGVWTLVIYLIARGNVRNYKKVLEQTIESYKAERDVIDRTHQEEIEKRSEAIRKHNEALRTLEEKYEKAEEELSYEKRARFTELMKMHEEDPQAIDELLQKEFGFTYVD